MMRWLTAGESHGSGLVGIIEGLPAGIEITTADIQEALLRRRLGYGRGARMKFEKDQDRKSTRLNSSHVATSYAVFCLKKKKVRRPVNISLLVTKTGYQATQAREITIEQS